MERFRALFGDAVAVLVDIIFEKNEKILQNADKGKHKGGLMIF